MPDRDRCLDRRDGNETTVVVWMRRVLLPHRAPGLALPPFNDLQDLHEVHDMLAERIKHWHDRWIEEGRQEGLEKALRTQIALRFGDLPDWAEQRLASATSEQLNEWIVGILEADSLESLLGPPGADA